MSDPAALASNRIDASSTTKLLSKVDRLVQSRELPANLRSSSPLPTRKTSSSKTAVVGSSSLLLAIDTGVLRLPPPATTLSLIELELLFNKAKGAAPALK